jgi:hypothetical protein
MSLYSKPCHQEPLLLWRTYAEDRVSLSEGGVVATQILNCKCSLTTTGTELMEGKHYWEVELLSEAVAVLVGISRPNLDPKVGVGSTDRDNAWFINASNGALYGNGKVGSDGAGEYKQGDSVGVLLDLDSGSLRFFKNGVEHGPGYPAGSVTGPVVCAVQMFCEVTSLRLLPNAEAPADM